MISIQHGTKWLAATKDVLGESKGGALLCKNTSWWNEEVKAE